MKKKKVAAGFESDYNLNSADATRETKVPQAVFKVKSPFLNISASWWRLVARLVVSNTEQCRFYGTEAAASINEGSPGVLLFPSLSGGGGRGFALRPVLPCQSTVCSNAMSN